ncbi:MAG: hypothetical protein WKH64_16550 [Chloroflexia bacterium]
MPYSFHGQFKDEDGNVAAEYFLEGIRIATDDIVIAAVYDFSDPDEQEDGEMPEAPPAVGGGGMSGRSAPSAPPARWNGGGSSIAYRR